MSANTNPGGAIRNLPSDLIREIASKLVTPAELLDFACVCKRMKASIGILEMAKIDVMYQINTNMDPDSEELDPASAQKVLRYIYRPTLIWAIETGKDINYIRQCIKVYQADFPEGLNGKWYPCCKIRTFHEGQFPTPMFAATKVGRLDVVKALFECGASLRNGGAEFPARRVGGRRVANDDDVFALACMSRHEDIAKFIISNVVEVLAADIWFAVVSGCFQALKRLLDRRFFDDNRHDAIVLDMISLLFLGREFHIAKHRMIKPLLDSIRDPKFDKAEYFRFRLGSAFRPGVNAKYVHEIKELIKFYQTWASPPSWDRYVVCRAAQNDRYLEIVKIMLSGDFGGYEGARTKIIEDMLRQTIHFNCPRIAKYLLGLGYKFPSGDLEKAILYRDFEEADKMMTFGVPMISNINTKLCSYTKILQVVFWLCRYKSMPGRRSGPVFRYASAFRMIYHGADFTNFPDDLKDLFYRELRKRYFYDWYHSDEANEAKATTASRLSFAQAKWVRTTPPHQYMEQLHAMATLILGENYAEELERKYEWSLRKDEAPDSDSDTCEDSDSEDEAPDSDNSEDENLGDYYW
ncbi:hypothetical protein F5Y13DRAFT_201980 [Hypoxylon sp. FL1857]|nr:hypothetical protein F5Y13DRAFT_201980 [Hypoxylon sp. FL1857]